MSEQLQFILEIAIGGALVYVSIRVHLLWFSEILKKVFGKHRKLIFITTMIVRLLVGIVGAHLILNYFVPGQATINVHAPKEFPTVLENLRTRIAPIRFEGTIDPDRMTHSIFAQDGKVSKIVVFDFLEHRLSIKLYDETRPREPLAERIVPVSLYHRLGIIDKNIYF